MEGIFQRRRGGAPAGRGAPAAKLHSIAGLLRDREIAGVMEAGGRSHEFSFAPSSVAVSGGRIELAGAVSAGPAAGRPGKRATLASVRETLASTQGGIGRAPPARPVCLFL